MNERQSRPTERDRSRPNDLALQVAPGPRVSREPARRRSRKLRIAYDGAVSNPSNAPPRLLTSRDDEGTRRGPYEAVYEILTGYSAGPE